MHVNKKDISLYLVFVIIIAIAFFLRFYHLDERVFHHDEAAVGFFTYKLFNDGVYSYDPAFHGPFMYYVTSEIYRHYGDTIYASRLLPAVFGGAMLLLLMPLRKYIGKIGIVICALFFALSPSFLYYSRFYREDIFISFFTLLALVCAVKYAEELAGKGYSILRIFYLFIGAVALASMAALKENAYIIMALIVLFLILFLIRERWYRGLITKIRDRRTLILIAEGSFFIIAVLVIFSLYYTGKWFDLYGMKAAFLKAVSHWYQMHSIQRMGGPLYFYIPIIALYELPVLVFGIAGIFHYYRKNDILMIFLGYWAMANLIVYSYIQEKVPWLVLNPLLPLVLIAGAYIGEVLSGKIIYDPKIRAAAVIFLVVSSSFFVYSSVFLNYYGYTNTAGPLIQAAQPPQRFSEFLGKISETSRQYRNQSTEVEVADEGIETQFLWYLRHYPNVKWKVNIDYADLNAPLIVVKDSDEIHEPDIVQERLGSDYKRLDSAKMSWYWFKFEDIPHYLSPDYLLFRKMNVPPGEARVTLFYKPKVD